MRKIIIVLLLMGVCGIGYADWFDDMEYQLVNIERPAELKDLWANFPFLQVLDATINWTGGINWYIVKDKRTGEIYEAHCHGYDGFEPVSGWNFIREIDGVNWFSDELEGKYWRWKVFPTEKEYLDD